MRITEISVTNLFKVFNHTIPINTNQHITIIHGPNGYGKTTLLRLVDGLFNSGNLVLSTIPYSLFQVVFENGSRIYVERGDANETLTFSLAGRGMKTQVFKLSKRDYNRIPRSILVNMITERVDGLVRTGYGSWHYIPTGEDMNEGDILERFGELTIPHQIGNFQKIPDWLEEIRKSVNVRFIQAQRLFGFPSSRWNRERERHSTIVPSVASYSEELAKAIKSKLAEYAAMSQSLDRTFPARLVKVIQDPSNDLTVQDLQNKLHELENKRSRLIAAGLLDEDKERAFHLQHFENETISSVMSVYVKDVEQKLSVLDEIAEKIDLLKMIINSRFMYKQVSIDKEKGFIFKTPDDNILSPADLSSGEQHQLVLLYELLFSAKPGSFVLIDEPELSFHVGWQDQFLKDLQAITKLTNQDVLLATHSPQIISDRWDLTVELKGPEK